MRSGGIILCGGRSSRMGTDKALLPIGDELMLQRIVRLLGEVVSPIVVVAAVDQVLPTLPSDIILAHDQHPERGPLEGLHAGLAAIAPFSEAAYVTGCDTPLLQAAFVRHLLEKLGQHQIVVPLDEGHYHPLAGVYRVSVLPIIRAMLDRNERPLHDLLARADTLGMPVEDLRAVDPELDSLRNLNTVAEYEAVFERLGK